MEEVRLTQQFKTVNSLPELLTELDKDGVQGGRRYQAVKEYVGYKAREKNIPVSGGFELTPLCNLDCKMCYVHLTPVQLPKEHTLLTVEQWKDIIRQAVDAGMLYADVTGGECLTYPGFREVYEYLFSFGVSVSILTNGRLLTEEMVQFFIQYPPDVVQISLYGSDNDAYERVTGHRAFDEVVAGIERAKAAGLNLKLVIMPSRYMEPDAESLLERIRSFDLPYTIGAVMLPARPETKRQMDDFAIDLNAFAALNRANEALNADPDEEERPFIRYVPPKTPELSGLPCGGAHSGFHINWKGEISPCIAYSSVSMSVLENRFEDAWREICRRMKAYRQPAECADCKLAKDCVTCPGEKTLGELNGSLNQAVCEKLRLRMEQNPNETEKLKTKCT